MKEIAFEGALTTGDNQRYTEINIRLPKTNLTVKGIGRDAMIKNKATLPEEHGVYILEADDICYVGQSQNLKARLSGHFSAKKINFERVFFLSRGHEDLRDRLDFMEKYLYKRMKDEGYELSNDKELNPDTDILISYKKATVSDWIDEFLLFLPILGFKKIKQKLKITNETKEIFLKIESKSSKEQPFEIQNQEINNYFHKNPLRRELIKLLSKIPLDKLMSSPQLFSKGIQIKKEPFKLLKWPFSSSTEIINNNGEKFYITFHIDNNGIRRHIKRISQQFNIS